MNQDDTKAAAIVGKSLLAIFNKTNVVSINKKIKKAYLVITESAKENAVHIGDNEGKLDHQKKHFEILAKDIKDFTYLFNSGKN